MDKPRFRSYGAAVVLLGLASLSVRAQDTQPLPPIDPRIKALIDRQEKKIEALEEELKTVKEESASRETEAAADLHADQVAKKIDDLTSRAGGLLDQTTRYDNRYNPAIGVIGDFVLSGSSQHDSYDRFNKFNNRGAELNVLGRIDPYGYYSLVCHMTPEEVEFEEGYGVIDQGLPSTFSLKAGKFYGDFGKLIPVHDHELPFVDKPACIQEFLGGGLIGSGIEIHHYFGVCETPVRWSIGAYNDFEGDTLAVVGPVADGTAGGPLDGSTADAFGSRDLGNFVWHARVTTVLDLGCARTLQLGASGLWVPDAFSFNPDPLDPAHTLRTTLEKHVIGVDLTYKWLDPKRDDSFTFGTEALFNSQRFIVDPVNAPLSTERENAFGAYAYAEYAWSKSWSAGVIVDWFQRARDASSDWYDGGVFVTYNLDHFNRVRLELQVVHDDLFSDSYFVAMLQWTTLIGSHAHPLDW